MILKKFHIGLTYVCSLLIALHFADAYAQDDKDAPRITINTYINDGEEIQEMQTVIEVEDRDQVAAFLDSIIRFQPTSSIEITNQLIDSEFIEEASIALDSILSGFKNTSKNLKGKVVLGVMLEEFDKSSNSKYAHPHVSNIIPNSPAEKAGLLKDDIIYLVEGQKVKSHHDLVNLVSTKSNGDTIELNFIRKQDTLTAYPVLKAVQQEVNWQTLLQQGLQNLDSCASKPSPFCKKIMIQKSGPKLGLKIRNLDQEARKALKVKKGGALVTEVFDYSTAKEMNLQLHDVITKLNGYTIQNILDVKNILETMNPSDDITVQYIRYGKKKKAQGQLKDFSQEWDDEDIMNIIDLSGFFEED